MIFASSLSFSTFVQVIRVKGNETQKTNHHGFWCSIELLSHTLFHVSSLDFHLIAVPLKHACKVGIRKLQQLIPLCLHVVLSQIHEVMAERNTSKLTSNRSRRFPISPMCLCSTSSQSRHICVQSVACSWFWSWCGISLMAAIIKLKLTSIALWRACTSVSRASRSPRMSEFCLHSDS